MKEELTTGTGSSSGSSRERGEGCVVVMMWGRG